MKRCRCCRQEWPLECFRVIHGDERRSKCKACEAGCSPAARRSRHAASALRSWHAKGGGPVTPVNRRIIMGPAPCQSCRLPLTWNGWGWEDADGMRHRHPVPA